MNSDLEQKLVAANSLLAEMRVEVDELKVVIKKIQEELKRLNGIKD